MQRFYVAITIGALALSLSVDISSAGPPVPSVKWFGAGASVSWRDLNNWDYDGGTLVPTGGDLRIKCSDVTGSHKDVEYDKIVTQQDIENYGTITLQSTGSSCVVSLTKTNGSSTQMNIDNLVFRGYTTSYPATLHIERGGEFTPDVIDMFDGAGEIIIDSGETLTLGTPGELNIDADFASQNYLLVVKGAGTLAADATLIRGSDHQTAAESTLRLEGTAILNPGDLTMFGYASVNREAILDLVSGTFSADSITMTGYSRIDSEINMTVTGELLVNSAASTSSLGVILDLGSKTLTAATFVVDGVTKSVGARLEDGSFDTSGLCTVKGSTGSPYGRLWVRAAADGVTMQDLTVQGKFWLDLDQDVVVTDTFTVSSSYNSTLNIASNKDLNVGKLVLQSSVSIAPAFGIGARICTKCGI